jgi:hypothetical protein
MEMNLHRDSPFTPAAASSPASWQTPVRYAYDAALGNRVKKSLTDVRINTAIKNY